LHVATVAEPAIFSVERQDVQDVFINLFAERAMNGFKYSGIGFRNNSEFRMGR
jgi:hypothetical protein